MIISIGTVIACWSSKGGKWTAELIVNPEGYRLAEKKNGYECGAAWRPTSYFASKAGAIQWATNHVKNCFDVPMKRMQ